MKPFRSLLKKIKNVVNKGFWKYLGKIKAIEIKVKGDSGKTKIRLPLQILKYILSQEEDPLGIYLDEFYAELLHTTLSSALGNGIVRELFPAKLGLNTVEKATARVLDIDLYQKISAPGENNKNVFEKIFNMTETEFSKIFATPGIMANWRWMGIAVQREYQALIKDPIYKPLSTISSATWDYKDMKEMLNNVVAKEWDKIYPILQLNWIRYLIYFIKMKRKLGGAIVNGSQAGSLNQNHNFIRGGGDIFDSPPPGLQKATAFARDIHPPSGKS